MTEEKTYLQEYYETKFKNDVDPEWKDIDFEYRDRIRNGLGYSLWRAAKALEEAKQTVIETLFKN